jgi:hypothetical protein
MVKHKKDPTEKRIEISYGQNNGLKTKVVNIEAMKKSDRPHNKDIFELNSGKDSAIGTLKARREPSCTTQ